VAALEERRLEAHPAVTKGTLTFIGLAVKKGTLTFFG
jgi:hypothetical protein